MRQRLLKQISRTALALMLTLAFAQMLVSAQETQNTQTPSAQESQDEQRPQDSRESSAHARKLEGVWESQVTVRNCQTGDAIKTFRGMTMFSRGGSLAATNNNPPTTGSPAFGRWQYLGEREYTATFRFFLFRPDGSFAGVQRVRRKIVLGQDDDHFTGTISIEIFDANDNLIGTGCATEIARRVE